ncbi:hypothetical protein C7475_1011336 [Chitinophaga sp. S165]|nr:hypothetical protein C7475_1011336 [Chitinophaga sp. S165]
MEVQMNKWQRSKLRDTIVIVANIVIKGVCRCRFKRIRFVNKRFLIGLPVMRCNPYICMKRKSRKHYEESHPQAYVV